MKRIIRKSLITSNIIILATFFITGITSGEWRYFVFTLQILAVSITIHTCQLLTDKFESAYYILEVFVEFLMVLVVVLLYGSFFGWYSGIDLTFFLLIGNISIVYIIACIFENTKAKKDVDFINKQLRLRKKRNQ